MKQKSYSLTIAVMALTALPAFPWGQKGHDTVEFIAENHLTPVAREKAGNLIGGKSIVYHSNWLDNASHTPEYAFTKTWHYKNVDADETFRSACKEPKGDVVRAINEQTEILRDPEATDSAKSLALKIVVHLVGDIHQPMHLGRRSDLGGNRVNVRFFKNQANLHSVWDSRILESGHKWSYTEWQQQIDRATPEETAEILSLNNADKWGEETYCIAKKIYETTPVDTNIEYNYIAEWTPVIEQQLLKGGLRLADLLNTVFDPDYNGAYAPYK